MASVPLHTVRNETPHYSYDLSAFAFNQHIPPMAGDIFNFTIRVFCGNTFPELVRSCPFESIPCHSFIEEGPDFLRRMLTQFPHCDEFREEIVEGVVDDVQEMFCIDSVIASPPPLESQPRNFPFLLKIIFYDDDDDMLEAIEESLQSFKMIPASDEDIQMFLKKSMNVAQGDEYCSICMEEFDANTECSTMPCDHVFHSQCIVPWLQKSHLCPLCRYALPTQTSKNNC